MKYLCWNPDHGESPTDGRTYEAENAIDAATSYVEYTDARSAEYSCAGGSRMAIHVRQPGRKAVRVRVTGEAVPVYTGELLEGGTQ